jgi:xanthine dehydrogenase YagR molybdenum-binding subunit
MPWPKETRYLGKARPRVEAPAKVTGRAQYTTDIAPSGLLYAAVFRSRWAAAEIRSINLEKARAAPGIRAAVLAQNCPRTVHFHGQELAALAGTSRQAVLDALDLIEVEAKPLPAVVHELDAIQPDAPRVNADRANLCEAVVEKYGDADAAFASAAAVVEGTFTTPVLFHQPMEPHGLTIKCEGEDATAWASTQGVFNTREAVARALETSQSNVRVLCEHMGGGFGGKIEAWAHNDLCAKLARAAGGAPVRLVLTRSEQALSVGNRPATFQHVKLAADRDGKFTGYELTVFGTPGWTAHPGDPGGSVVDFPAPFFYQVPNTRVRRAKLATHAGPATWMRAPGFPVAAVAMEGIIDELAVKLGADPVELRLKNDPNGLRQQEFRLGAERFGWKQKYRAPGSSPGPAKVGVGCAGGAWWGAGGNTQADVQVNPDGTVEVRVGTQDLGTGSRTVAQLVAAEILGLDAGRVVARVGDTQLPPSGVSGGSTTTASISPAVFDACENALTELKKAAGVDDPRGARWNEACARLDAPLVAHGRWHEGLSSGGVGGVQFAEVEADTETGFVRVRKILAVQDCGLVVNRLTCESQINGGVIMGLGFALYERRVMDARTGVVLNANFETYKLPGAADMPDIDILLLDMPERGVIGVAEPCTVPTAAAIANAVANALGVRVWSLPLTPDKVLAALGKLPPEGKETQKTAAAALDAAFAQVAAAPVGSSPQQSSLPRHRRKIYA